MRVAIEHGGEGVVVGRRGELCGDVGQGRRRVELVAGVEEENVVAGGLKECFVHRIVEPLVRFGAKHEGAAVFDAFIKRKVLLYQLRGVVFRSAVDYKVLDVRIILSDHALQGAAQRGGGVVTNGGDGKTNHKREVSGESR